MVSFELWCGNGGQQSDYRNVDRQFDQAEAFITL
jgi:hypothetical protein